MNDALFVRRFEGVGDLLSNREGVFDCHRPLADEVSQRRALDELEDERPHGGAKAPRYV